MVVTAWNNGSHHPTGAGYGLKIAAADRDRYFKREWDHVILELDGRVSSVEVNVKKKSFWSESCRELIHAEIGRWLIERQLAPWTKGRPPQLKLQQIEGRRFRLTLLHQ